MKTIVVSDTALLGLTYNNTIEGIKMIKDLQEQGNKIVVLSNDPEYRVHKIGAISPINYVSKKEETKATKEATGIRFVIHKGEDCIRTLSLNPDYIVLGNGVRVINKENETIYQDKFISKDTLNELEICLHDLGFTKPVDAKEEDSTYRFLTPNNEELSIHDNTYSVRCNNRGSILNGVALSEIEHNFPSLKGYIIDDMPHFYSKEINKLKALREVFKENPDISFEDTMFVLDNVTDDVLLSKYDAQIYCTNGMLTNSERVVKDTSLASVLKKVK